MSGSTADLIRAGVQQAAAGVAVDTDSIGSMDTSTESLGSTADEGDFVDASDSIESDGLESEGSEDALTDSSSTEGEKPAPKAAAAEKTSANREVITVTDETGRRRKVEIDHSNRQATRKAYEMMYGARKWQAERDRAISSSKQLQEKLQESESNWQVMNEAFSKNGIEGLVDLLEGRKGAYKDHVAKQIDRAKFLERASPEEVEALKIREELDRERRESQRNREENEKFRKKIEEEREAAEEAALKSRINPAFEKHRFKGKLGDANDEHLFDEMLWNSTLKRLEPYEEQGLDLSAELIEREFRAVASAVRKRISGLAERKASSTIAQKKQEATENVQSKVKSGYREGGTVKEARDMLNQGNLKGLLKNWGKYGGVFNK